MVLGTPTEETWPGVHSLPHLKTDRFPQYSSKNLRHAWNKLDYVAHAEDLASKLLQCFPKNRLSAPTALNHEYFSDLPPRLWELSDMSSVFTVPTVKLQAEIDTEEFLFLLPVQRLQVEVAVTSLPGQPAVQEPDADVTHKVNFITFDLFP
ncbi:hypothetical protein scyTo_0013033 [Scyliorhinus torazame]|uniref:Protein kinase domain-containing protein n=1 Tax=Scyliorhinus torazame TaxID=75743 RepID=A0A401NMS0_SCYTO|nr:hypothetical protein [Scyliorhinus torazame]